MEKIGEGWQYSVYSIQNDRVLKKIHSIPRAIQVIVKTMDPPRWKRIHKLAKYVKGVRKDARDSVQEVKKRPELYKLFGNPNFLNEYNYEQDKVEPLTDYLRRVSSLEGKRSIDSFIQLARRMVDARVIDKKFNIGQNFGITTTGEIIAIDLGELETNAERIQKRITERVWKHSYVLRGVPLELQNYFLEKMDREFVKK